MRIRFSANIIRKLKEIKKKDKALLRKIQKQLELFKDNPVHPSLRLHKLSGSMKQMWSISINRNVRMVYLLLTENEVYFIDIGTHDEIYG